MSPAPWAVDMRNDHIPSSRSETRIEVQRKCARGLTKRKIPKRDQRRGGADPQLHRVGRRAQAEDEQRHERDRRLVADRDRHERAQHGAAAALLQAARDGEEPAHGRVDAVVDAEPGQGQPCRVGGHDGKQYESVEASPPSRRIWCGRSPSNSTKKFGSSVERAVVVELDHPAVDALGVELRVPGGVQRVGQVDALAVAADLDHLRAAVDGARGRVRRVADDPADAHAAGLLRVARGRRRRSA